MAQSNNANTGNLEEQLAALQWKSRVLVLYAPTAQHPEYVKQLRMLTDARDDLEERDLVQIVRTDEETDASTRNYLERELGVQPDDFNVLLIGKDGGVKYRSTKAADPQQLFSTIDAMPMRQSEMREKENQNENFCFQRHKWLHAGMWFILLNKGIFSCLFALTGKTFIRIDE